MIFKCSNINETITHHPVIQKEVGELLAKGSIQPLSGLVLFAQMCLWLLVILVT